MSTTDFKLLRKYCIFLVCLPLLGGCAGLDAGREMISGLSDSIFGGDDNADPPATLTEFTAEVQIDVLWKESVGNGADKQFLKLIPAVQGEQIFAADRAGTLQSRKISNGDSIWETKTDFNFSAGPGLSSKSVIMGCISGEVVSFDLFTGEQRWKAMAPSEVQAVPVIANGTVIIRTTDGKVVALRESDGGQIWNLEQTVPALSIRGAGTPIVIDGAVIVGAANGKLQAFQLKDGKSLWEATVAIPSGRSEVERLVDLDVDPIVNLSSIYIASFQGGTSAISQSDGDVIWRNEEVSSYTGISADRRHLYVSDIQSEVWQLDQRSGASLWRQKDLHNRQLTAAIAYDNFVVVGDFEGYVHWLSISDGRQLGRVQISSAPIEAKPVVVDGIVYIYAKDGTLAALKAK
jgi:outer membrane protein assembly factor BamB